MEHHSVTLKLPRKLLHEASNIAAAQDVTIGHLVRNLLKIEVNRRLHAKTPNRADERLVAALQALLASHLALADSWEDLAFRLAEEGFELRPAGGGLTLHRRPCGSRLCKASELGFPYRALVKRFECAMPGHPHGALNLVFAPSAPVQSDLPLDDEEMFEVIEQEM